MIYFPKPSYQGDKVGIEGGGPMFCGATAGTAGAVVVGVLGTTGVSSITSLQLNLWFPREGPLDCVGVWE